MPMMSSWFTFAPAAKEMPYPPAAWKTLWGPAGEREAVIVTVPGTFGLSSPQLDRLRPPQKGAPYGANLAALGIGKKK